MPRKDEMTIQALSKRDGMQPDEILTALGKAGSAGFTILHRTRVGFAGQIQEMIFRTPPGGDNESENEVDDTGAGPVVVRR